MMSTVCDDGNDDDDDDDDNDNSVAYAYFIKVSFVVKVLWKALYWNRLERIVASYCHQMKCQLLLRVCVCVCTRSHPPHVISFVVSALDLSICALPHFRFTISLSLPHHFASCLLHFMLLLPPLSVCMWLFFFHSFPFFNFHTIHSRWYGCSISYMSCQTISTVATTSWHIKFFNVCFFLSPVLMVNTLQIFHFPPPPTDDYSRLQPCRKRREWVNEWTKKRATNKQTNIRKHTDIHMAMHNTHIHTCIINTFIEYTYENFV